MALQPEARLTRPAAADALTHHGFPISKGTLADLVSTNQGPPYALFGKRAIYRWGDLLAWAESRLVPKGPQNEEAA